MVVLPADQCVGNLVQDRVADIGFGAVAGELERDGDYPVVIVAASGAPGTVVEFKAPLQQPVITHGFQRHLMNGFNPLLPLPGKGFRDAKIPVGYAEFFLSDAHERTAWVRPD
jgi:hypothetical protein